MHQPGKRKSRKAPKKKPKTTHERELTGQQSNLDHPLKPPFRREAIISAPLGINMTATPQLYEQTKALLDHIVQIHVQGPYPRLGTRTCDVNFTDALYLQDQFARLIEGELG